MMTAVERMHRCKARLAKNEPFYGYLIFIFQFIAKLSCNTMAVTQAGKLFFNEKFVEKQSEKDLTWILKHECLHIVLEHHPRMRHMQKMPGYNHMIANLAADCAVNWLLWQETQYQPSEIGCVIARTTAQIMNGKQIMYTVKDVGGKTIHEIYKELLDNLPKSSDSSGSKSGEGKKGDQEGESSGDGDGEESEKEGTGSGPVLSDVDLTMEKEAGKTDDNVSEELERKWKSSVAAAVYAAQQRGLLPASLKGMLEEMFCPKLPWTTVLRKFFTNHIIHDTTWSRPSRRAASAGLYLPSPKKIGIDLVLHIDTSGSMWADLDVFLSQLYWILKGVDHVKMTLLLCDADISSVRYLTKADLGKDTWKMREGGGGTSHAPVVNWIREKDPRCKIFISFTDGYSDIEHCYKNLPSSCHSMIVLPAKYKDMAQQLQPHAHTVLVLND